MRINKSIFRFLLAFVVMTFIFADYSMSSGKGSSVVARGAVSKSVQSDFTLDRTEGPATDAEGNVYFTEALGKRILKWSSSDGKISVYKQYDTEVIGMTFDDKGCLIVCESGNHRLIRDDLKGNITVIADSYEGNNLMRPNDVWVNPKGGIYFSDTQIYYISPDEKQITRVTNDVEGANGVIGTPDGKTLYVGGREDIWSFKIQPDGSLTDKKPFCKVTTPDGIAMDEKNNLYVTNRGGPLLVYNSKGEKIEEVPYPDIVYNLKFGGKDRKTLFLCCQKSVYTLEMAVKGAPTALDLARGN